MKKLLLILLVFAINLQAEKKLNVMTTIYPLYEAIKIVGAENINVQKLISYSQEIHEYSPTPKDVIKIINSDIFLYLGAGLDDFLINFRNKKLAYDLSENIVEKNADSHYWLDIDSYILLVKKVANILSKSDKANKESYEKRSKEYILELKKLNQEYKNTLDECKIDTIVVDHNAYTHLANKYNFKIHSISGSSGHSRVSAKNMKQAIDYLKILKKPIIFSEALSNDSALKVISQEANAELKVLETLENVTKKQSSETYISLMRNNLGLLKHALNCK